MALIKPKKIKKRLESIKYQPLKEGNIIYDDKKKLSVIQSIYDAAINADSEDLTDAEFPAEVMGLTVSWTANRRSFTIDAGLYEIINDDLTDDIVPDLGDQEDPYAVIAAGEFLRTTNEEYVKFVI